MRGGGRKRESGSWLHVVNPVVWGGGSCSNAENDWSVGNGDGFLMEKCAGVGKWCDS